jgi:ribosomal 50S subunit-associated protein YjgA (DUF615 family)
MLTAPQVTLYGKRWGAVCHANDWRMERGRLLPAGSASAAVSPLHREVFALAEQHAQQNHRAITVEDLRKGCVAAITGRYQSTKDLNNAQFSRLLALFRLLIDPDDIDARMDWDNPQRDEERRINHFIEHAAPDAYTRHIAGDRFGTRLWEDLPLADRKQLANMLRARKGNRAGVRRPVNSKDFVEGPF